MNEEKVPLSATIKGSLEQWTKLKQRKRCGHVKWRRSRTAMIIGNESSEMP